MEYSAFLPLVSDYLPASFNSKNGGFSLFLRDSDHHLLNQYADKLAMTLPSPRV